MEHDISTKGLKQDFNEKHRNAPVEPFGSSASPSGTAKGINSGEEDVNVTYDRLQQTGDPMKVTEGKAKPD